MAWNPYQDQKNRAYSHILTTLFPEQTKTLPRILVWSIIFLLDLIMIVCGAFYFGFLQYDGGYSNPNHLKLGSIGLFASLIGLFWLQGKLWGWLCTLWKKWRKSKEVSL